MLSIAAAVALFLAIAAAFVSARRAIAVGRALDLDVEQLATWAKRRTSRTASLRQAIGEDSQLAALATALDGPVAKRERGCNEALVDLSDALRHDDELHLGALRLTGYATGLAAVLTVFEPLRAVVAERVADAQPLSILDAVAIGGGSFVSILATRRLSQRASRWRRTAIDRWVAAVLAPPDVRGSK